MDAYWTGERDAISCDLDLVRLRPTAEPTEEWLQAEIALSEAIDDYKSPGDTGDMSGNIG